ncbi:MAG TPA: class I SAM-dependent methyltransferase, partial [Verrucomicrobiae bacterium]|nr:class I SAM-dependent methyltransferase [Verrucomicrobiae bacterium]
MADSQRSGGRRFDRDHGVTTHAIFFLSELDRDRRSEAYAHATHYEAVPVGDFRALMACLDAEVLARSTFVDVGAGMGRAVMLAMEFPFEQVCGIELSRSLHEIARENLAGVHDLRVRCRDVRLLRGDARKARYPKGDLVLFLFNPFDAQALGATLARVRETREAGDETYVVYHTPVH